MATAQLGAVLRHIRDLAALPKRSEQTDGALLRAFLAQNDQTALEALLQRHGPMVLRVCRRALGNVHDAEDALQATFLVLAQNAASIRKRESLASWLHGVAYRMATDARRAAARRHRHESRAHSTPARDPVLSAAWRELQMLLDEEIAGLPDGLRAPFVLCCLESLSCAETAQQLGLPETTVRKRLSRARKLLQQRLTRRGVSLATVLAAAVGANDALAVPRWLVGPTAQAATQITAGQAIKAGPVSAKVITLVEGVNQAMLLSKCKRALLLLLCTAIVGTGVGLAALHGAGAESGPIAWQASQEATSEGLKERLQSADAPAKDKDAVKFAGLVLDAEGKPAAGAEVALLGEPKSNSPDNVGFSEKALAHGRADIDGRFRLNVARAALADYRAVYAIVGKAGHGLAWAKAELTMPSHETLVRLAPEKIVRGRLIDLQGQPTVGVRVSVSMLHGHGLAWKNSGVTAFVSSPKGFTAWPSPATTGKDGKFTIAGLSPDLGGALAIDGEEFTATHAEIKAGKENRNQEVNLTQSPARILEGLVTTADSGKPVPRASIVCLDGGAPAYTVTDEKGRYRLRVAGGGHPGAPSGISAVPPEGQPYLRQTAPFEWPQGAVKHRINLALARGVSVRGIVTDAASGKPIAGAKAMAVVTGELLWSPDTPRVLTKDDGAFALVVPTGRRGHVLVKGPNNDFVAVEISNGELLGGKRNGGRCYASAIIPFESKPGTDTLDVNAKLRRGVTVRGRLVGPGDKPVAGALMVCWNRVDNSGQWEGYPLLGVPVSDGTFELRGCDPEMTYPVYFLDARNKLGATAQLSAKEAAGKEVTIRLEPCGSAVVRYVDKEGKPLKGHRPHLDLVLRPGDKGVGADTTWLVNIDTVNYRPLPVADAEGRCTFPALIPGATYAGFSGNQRKELTVKSGETLKFEVVIKPAQ
jgi:RNA polymerase sigma factor (sigma-70 family)